MLPCGETAMKVLTDAQIVELRVQALKRLIELHAENKKLKNEVKARRRQADYWRKKLYKRNGKL